MSIIDEALSANATIANGYDPSRGGPPAPWIAIVTCADPRLTDIEQMLGLADRDVDVTLQVGQGLPHVYQLLLGTPEAAEATEQIGKFLRARGFPHQIVQTQL